MAFDLGTTLAPLPSIFRAPSHCQFCHTEGLYCSMSSGTVTGLIKPPFNARRASDLSSMSFGCRNPLFGVQSNWLSTGQESSPLKVCVAADYSDSVPNSSNYMGNLGYHPLEELKDYDRSRDKMLTGAEIARTTIEANSSALLLFPGMVHSEPHEQASWAEFQYVIDDFGDVFFEIFDDENMLLDRGASNPVTVFIGMDFHITGGNSDISSSYSAYFDNEEVADTEVSSILIDWGMPDTLRRIHPRYFAKCLTKAVHTKYRKMMDHPSNGLSIVGCLRPAFIDEESYLRTLFPAEDTYGGSDWKDGEILSLNSKDYGGSISSTLYKLDIINIDLYSVYGDKSTISVQDFQDAEPDVLVHSASAIVERFSESGMNCNVALKALCRKKKGLNVEGANLIGVDSLGMDVRAFSGVEAQTIRFSFNAQAMSESAAEKKIRRLLFPRNYRKNYKTSSDGRRDFDSF
ncbi:uncharacterized protein At3g49140 [Magnolia sinica]|uniref:uncharacterized protein At3g49140 n=1 Tax=Magnolia sinica TaxID=86752 RepID=UPI00265A65AB|nr:uncharacterized protein At3g49140 [Magnolia sinica]